MDPNSSFFDNVIDNGSILIITKYVLYSISNGDHGIPGDASNGLYLIFEWSVGIGVGKLEHKFNFVLILFASVWLALNGKFLRVCLPDGMELL